MYILYARTPDQPLSCIHARLFGQMWELLLIPRSLLRTMRDASVCPLSPRVHVSSLCDCARPGPLIKFVSPNVHGVTASIRCLLFFFFPSPVPSTLRIRLWYPHPRVFPSFFSRDTCSSPIGSVVRLAASGDPFRFASLRDDFSRFSRIFSCSTFPFFFFFFFTSVFRHVAPYNRSYECYFQLRQMILINLINVQQSSNWKGKNDAMLSFANGSR